MLYTGLTYSGHPLSCAAGVGALAAYREERLIERSRRLGETIGARLRALASRHAAVGDVRGDGAFWVVELAELSWPETLPALRALVGAGLARGVSFAVRGNLVLIAPPLVITDEELDRGLSLLEALLIEILPNGG